MDPEKTRNFNKIIMYLCYGFVQNSIEHCSSSSNVNLNRGYLSLLKNWDYIFVYLNFDECCFFFLHRNVCNVSSPVEGGGKTLERSAKMGIL